MRDLQPIELDLLPAIKPGKIRNDQSVNNKIVLVTEGNVSIWMICEKGQDVSYFLCLH